MKIFKEFFKRLWRIWNMPFDFSQESKGYYSIMTWNDRVFCTVKVPNHLKEQYGEHIVIFTGRYGCNVTCLFKKEVEFLPDCNTTFGACFMVAWKLSKGD